MKNFVLAALVTMLCLWGEWNHASAEDYTFSIMVKAGDIIDGRTMLDVANFSMNNNNEIVFRASNPTTGEGLYTQNTILVERNDFIAGKQLELFVGPNASPMLNDLGQVAFRAEFRGTNRPLGIFTLDSLLAEVGDVVGTKTIASFSDFVAINNSGDVAYAAFFNDGSSGTLKNGIPFALPGDTIAGKTLTSIGSPPRGMNNLGEIPFIGFFDGGSGIFTSQELVVQSGGTIDGTTFTDFFDSPCINDLGDIVFKGRWPLGLYTRDTRLVTAGDVIDGITLTGFSFHVINNAGDIAFLGNHSGGNAVFTPDTVVAQPGDVVDGKTMIAFGAIFLNDHGDMAFSVRFADSTRGIVFAEKVTNISPVADAGVNVSIHSSQQLNTTLSGTATDPDNDPLTYRWLEGTTELLASTTVVGGDASLDLSILSPFIIGEHTLTLEVSDGQAATTDEMVLTVENSPPVVAASGGGTFQLGSNITLRGNVSDFDGDGLNYRWFEGSTDFTTSFISTIAGGTPVVLPDFIIIGGLSLGSHILTLEADDSTNTPVSEGITVDVIDTTAPAISATANPGILWPANHQMIDVIIQADAADNSGSVTLTASVISSEPPDTDGDGNTIPDYTTPVIDQSTGEITLQLRSERKGQGTGRSYTITVTATDYSGNSSDAVVEVVAPHDKGKK